MVDTINQRNPRYYTDYGRTAKVEFFSDHSIEERGAWLVIWAIGGMISLVTDQVVIAITDCNISSDM